jgi:hypothetical protein
LTKQYVEDDAHAGIVNVTIVPISVVMMEIGSLPSLQWSAEATPRVVGRLLIVTMMMIMIVMMTKVHDSECPLLSHF